MPNWSLLAHHGDEWLAAYAALPGQLANVHIFTVGHALELYLKAAHT